MKKLQMLLMFVVLSLAFAKYEIGDVCYDDITWTDNDGLETSIFSETAKGKAVLIFWGSTG